MTTPFGSDRLITAWLEEQAPMREPDALLDSVIERVERTRRLPGWVLLERWIPMQTRAKFGAIPRTAVVLVTLALLAVLLGAVALAGTSPAPKSVPLPFGPAANGLIAYSKGGDIMVAEADGSNPRAIVSGTDEDIDPVFSHDGSKLFFVRRPGVTDTLMVASVDGTGVTEVVNGAQGADFLPGDRQVAIEHFATDRNVLSIYDLDTSTLRTLSTGDVEPNGWVAARPPDGKEIVFTAWAQHGRPDRALYAVGVDGSGLRLIGDLDPTDSADEADAASATFSLQHPQLSPDGGTVSYWSWEPTAGGYGPSEPRLHLRELDSGAEVPVPAEISTSGYGLLPHFSPDGDNYLYEGAVGSGAADWNQLWYGPVDGITAASPNGPAYQWALRSKFDFSPDGTKVLLAQGPPGVSVLIDLATGESTPIDGVDGPWSWQRLALSN
jgi:hypothetical protein